jgi:hypothetical protein
MQSLWLYASQRKARSSALEATAGPSGPGDQSEPHWTITGSLDYRAGREGFRMPCSFASSIAFPGLDCVRTENR